MSGTRSGISSIPVGTKAHVGTAVLDYGTTPAYEAQVDIAGQTGILPTSHVRVWFQGETMGSNSAQEHLMAGALVRLTPSDPIADVGFTIYADNVGGLATNKFRIDWLWS